jgi:hypothetical protein
MGAARPVPTTGFAPSHSDLFPKVIQHRPCDSRFPSAAQGVCARVRQPMRIARSPKFNVLQPNARAKLNVCPLPNDSVEVRT